MHNIVFVLYGTIYLSIGLMNVLRIQQAIPFQYRPYENIAMWQQSWGWTNIFAGILSCIGFVLFDSTRFVFNPVMARMILTIDFAFLIVHFLYLTPASTYFSPYHMEVFRCIQIVIIFEYIILLIWLSLCAGRWGSVVQTLG